MADFACEVLTPYRHFFSGRAESVLLVTHDGQIEILTDHEPIVAPVRVGILRIRAEGKDRRAAVTEGFIRVKKGRVDIFVDAAEWPEEIDRERAERALGRAQQRLVTAPQSWTVAASKRAAARAQNRLSAAEWAPRSSE